MTTTEERLRILQMIQEGKVSAEEGTQLLEALGHSNKQSVPPAQSGPAGHALQTLCVRITDLDTGKTKINVTIPLSLVNVGIKLGARFMPANVDVDYDEIMTTIEAGIGGQIVDVEDIESGEHVEVWVE